MENKKKINFSKKYDLKLQIDYTNNIIDKLFVTSMWNNGKLNSILTVNGLIGTGIFLFFRSIQEFSNISIFFVLVSLVFFIISILICLSHSIPLYDSKIGNDSNPRTIIGILKYDKENYHSCIKGLSDKEMLLYNSHQIAGMARNNNTAKRRITSAAITSFIGFAILGVALLINVIETLTKLYSGQ